MAYHPFRHLGLKFVALALATLLWLTVAGEHVVERNLTPDRLRWRLRQLLRPRRGSPEPHGGGE